ncbi:MAG: hypothetical protein LBP68_00140 [Acidobacteriota bacterium]|nr:hypothetical protein [Acidobacteriota bacterium]
MVYVVHLVLIYGCAWYPGMNRYFHRKQTGSEAATAATVMVALMLLLVALIGLAGKIKSEWQARRAENMVKKGRVLSK